MREPCIMRWPGEIPPGIVCKELATTLDLFPTFAGLTGGKLPEQKIDGHDIWPLISGQKGAKSPWEVWYCYYMGGLQAVRTPRWKLQLPHTYRTLDGRPGGRGGLPVEYSYKEIGLTLYDMQNDNAETTDVAEKYPEVVAQLQGYAGQARAELGDELTGVAGSGIRPSGTVDWNTENPSAH